MSSILQAHYILYRLYSIATRIDDEILESLTELPKQRPIQFHSVLSNILHQICKMCHMCQIQNKLPVITISIFVFHNVGISIPKWKSFIGPKNEVNFQGPSNFIRSSNVTVSDRSLSPTQSVGFGSSGRSGFFNFCRTIALYNLRRYCILSALILNCSLIKKSHLRVCLL